MPKETAGIIYDLGGGKYGLALHKDQVPNFKRYGKVFMRQFTDILCTIKDTDPATGKQYVTLKHITELRQVGFTE